MVQLTKRAQTLKLLVQNSGKLGAVAKSRIVDELNEIANVGAMQPLRRRRLLRALHLARGLETGLREVTSFHALPIAPNERNMGTYLVRLANNAIIPQTIKDDCHNRVRTLRNRIAHGAGEYPLGDPQLNAAAEAASACFVFMLK